MNDNIKNIDTTFELTPGLKKLQGATTYFEKLKEMTLLGVTSGMKSSGNIIALFLLNFLFLIIAGCIIGFSSKFEYKQLVYLAVVVLLGGLFVFLAVKRMLSLLQLDYTLYVFNQFEPFIRKICAAIVDKAEKSTEKIVTTDQVKGVFNTYISKIPPVFQQVLWLLLSQVPVVGFVAEIYRTPLLDTYEKRSDRLVARVKQYIQHSIEMRRKAKFLAWVLPLNIVLQIIVIYLLSR